jgi:endonuclease YncB( thermonuclease family)
LCYKAASFSRSKDVAMLLHPRINSPLRHRVAAALPWVFVIGVAVGTMLPLRRWAHLPPAAFRAGRTSWPDQAQEVLWARGGNPDARYGVDVLRTIDGDTFVARVHLSDRDIVTRVRLRGIDAPELKAACAREFRMAQAASSALRALLDDGGVTISNIGADKYARRVDADVATARTPNVSSALLASGQVRSYNGGHRSGWCGASWWGRF